MKRRRLLGRLSILGGVGLAGCTAIPGIEDDFDVGMSQNAFQPDTLTVSAGEVVVWLNNGSRGHTVTAYEDTLPSAAEFFASGGFESESSARVAWEADDGGHIAPGERYTSTFAHPGRYPYFCIPHESRGMVGTITVEAGE